MSSQHCCTVVKKASTIVGSFRDSDAGEEQTNSQPLGDIAHNAKKLVEPTIIGFSESDNDSVKSRNEIQPPLYEANSSCSDIFACLSSEEVTSLSDENPYESPMQNKNSSNKDSRRGSKIKMQVNLEISVDHSSDSSNSDSPVPTKRKIKKTFKKKKLVAAFYLK
jgi:hypothetical protein